MADQPLPDEVRWTPVPKAKGSGSYLLGCGHTVQYRHQDRCIACEHEHLASLASSLRTELEEAGRRAESFRTYADRAEAAEAARDRYREALEHYADERGWINEREFKGFPGRHGNAVARNAINGE